MSNKDIKEQHRKAVEELDRLKRKFDAQKQLISTMEEIAAIDEVLLTESNSEKLSIRDSDPPVTLVDTIIRVFEVTQKKQFNKVQMLKKMKELFDRESTKNSLSVCISRSGDMFPTGDEPGYFRYDSKWKG